MDRSDPSRCAQCGDLLTVQLDPRPGPPRSQSVCQSCHARHVSDRRRSLQARTGLDAQLIERVPEAMLLYVAWEAMSRRDARAFTLRLVR